MSYEYDVFISYKRRKEWPKWVSDVFLKMFKHWLGEELDYDAKIFCDLDIEAGSNWPSKLANAHAKSRVLVPLLSKQYFSSDWCISELALMKAREKECGFGCIDNPQCLIVPVIIHDCKDLHKDIKSIQHVSLVGYTSPWISEGSKKFEKMSDIISQDLAIHVAKAIESAPEFKSTWSKLAYDEFIKVYSVLNEDQNSPPRL